MIHPPRGALVWGCQHTEISVVLGFHTTLLSLAARIEDLKPLSNSTAQ